MLRVVNKAIQKSNKQTNKKKNTSYKHLEVPPSSNSGGTENEKKLRTNTTQFFPASPDGVAWRGEARQERLQLLISSRVASSIFFQTSKLPLNSLPGSVFLPPDLRFSFSASSYPPLPAARGKEGIRKREETGEEKRWEREGQVKVGEEMLGMEEVGRWK